MRRTWETKLEKFGVVNIRVEKCISIVDLWRAIFSAEAALRIARRCGKLHGDTLSAEVQATLQRYISDLEARLKVLKRVKNPTGDGPTMPVQTPDGGERGKKARMDSSEQWVRVFFGGMSTGECQACRREQRTLDRMPHKWQRALFKLTLAKHPVPNMNDHRKISMGYRIVTGVALFTYVAGSSFYIVRVHLKQYAGDDDDDEAKDAGADHKLHDQVDVNVVIFTAALFNIGVDLVIISPILSLLTTFVVPLVARRVLRRYLTEPERGEDDDDGELGTRGFELTTMPALMRAKNKFLGLRGRNSEGGDPTAGGAVVNPLQPEADADGVPEAKGDDDEEGVPEAKGEDAPEEDDWEEHACEVSGFPYYHSPSRQRTSWTAQGRFAVTEEEAQFDEADVYADSGNFEGTNPVHGD